MKRPCRPWSLPPAPLGLLFLAAFTAALLIRPTPGIAAGSAASAAATASGAVPFHGRVLDPAGEPVAGARVTVAGKREAAAVTDEAGRFALDLPAGTWTLRLELAGFPESTERVTVVSKAVSDEVAHDFTLAVGAQETITVEAPRQGYQVPAISSATRTLTPLRDVPQSVTVVTRQLMQDQLMSSLGDVVRYVPGIALHQGENNRDQLVIRGNSTSADFYVDGVRDDVQYYRDLYDLDRVEALKGPNAMIFGRGGGGGVINQVTKEAGFGVLREVDLQGGSFANRRATADLNQPLSGQVALRVNALYEDSGSFRDFVDLQRTGVAPTLTWLPDAATKVTLGYERLHDGRVADRGITSFHGRPADVDPGTYYGNPGQSHVRADVDLAAAYVEHRFGDLALHSRTTFGDYGRGYQNFVPGATSADGSQVTLTAYNNATQRRNLFNQTDLTYGVETGAVRHTLLLGAELGRQLTDNFRNTGYFDGTATSILVPFADPTTATTATFRQSATDASNHLDARVGAVYAQDQIELTPHLQLIAGARFDRFDLRFHNNRTGDDLGRTDDLVSPRAGVVVKPTAALSLYGSYSVSFLPSSGDQFASLTTVTEQLEPERFANYEVGAKWDAAEGLSLTTALYRLDRTNTRSTDPNDPTRIVQTGSQRTDGYELGINGQITRRWSVAGGYAWQDAFVTRATAAARAGAVVAQVPRHTLSLWNNVQLAPKFGAALGVICRSKMFAAIDDAVTLPGYTRVDVAGYVALTPDLRLQVNLENLFGTRDWANADSNTNLSPGAPRTLRVGLTARL